MSLILSIRKQLLRKTLMNRVQPSLHHVQTCHRYLPYSVMQACPMPIIHIWHPCHHDWACKIGPLHVPAYKMNKLDHARCLCVRCHDPLCSQGQSCFLACASDHVLMCTEASASQVPSSTDAPQTSDRQTTAPSINNQDIHVQHDDGYRPQVVLTLVYLTHKVHL